MSYKVSTFENVELLAESFAQWLINKLNCVDKFNLALSGGSTPKSIFKYLVKNHNNTIEWRKINFYWGDERCVPPTDEESNFKMTYENLFEPLNISSQNIFRILGEKDPGQESEKYEQLIKQNIPAINNCPKFDLIMLGLGEDGHTASIFPNQMELLVSKKICDVSVHPSTKQNRITLTGKVINNSSNVIFFVTGTNKASIVKQILHKEKDYLNYPAGNILVNDGELFWFLDNEAASLI